MLSTELKSAVVALEDRDTLGRFAVGNEARKGGLSYLAHAVKKHLSQ